MKILITGSSGQLGSEIKELSKNFKHDFIFTTKTDFDISDTENIFSHLDKFSPNIIINCAAYTNVDMTEKNYDYANVVNGNSMIFFSNWCEINNCRLIYISTDYVYSTEIKTPLKEIDLKKPVNKYGYSKLMGENACLKYPHNCIIIRTSWLYSSYGNNFVKKIIKKSLNTKKISVVCDQVGSPTYALDLAEFIFYIIFQNEWKPGVYNFSNKGSISWYEFAMDVVNICQIKNVKITPIKSETSKSMAQRPKYSVLDNTKTIDAFGLKQKDYLSSLRRCVFKLEHQKFY